MIFLKKRNKIVIKDLLKQYQTIMPKCQYFGECGGCYFQDLNYDDQLDLKKRFFNSIINRKIKNIKDRSLRDEFIEIFDKIDRTIYPTRKTLRYRTKIEMVCANNNKIGFRQRGKYNTVVDLNDCKIFDKITFSKFLTIKPLLKEFPSYNLDKHNGFLRYVVLRKGYNTNEDMITFITNGYVESFWKIIEKSQSIFSQVSWLMNTTYSDVANGEEVFSSGNISEKLQDKIFFISNTSFFQSNTYMTEVIYNKIKEYAQGEVIDLFGGTSTIGIFVSSKDNVSKVLTVDILKENIDIAKLNKEYNKAKKVELHLQDAKEFFRDEHKYDTLIIDPPRTGLEKKLVKKILSKNPKRFIYMSCNPATFLDDIEYMIQYRKEFLPNKKLNIEFFKAYDMFAQTPHFETLCVINFI